MSGKKFPDFKTDEEAERFVDTADLSEYDMSDMVPVKIEFKRKDALVKLRLQRELRESADYLRSIGGIDAMTHTAITEGSVVKKKIPEFKTDEEAQQFVATADLTEYDLRGEVVRFEYKHQDASASAKKRNNEKAQERKR